MLSTAGEPSLSGVELAAVRNVVVDPVGIARREQVRSTIRLATDGRGFFFTVPRYAGDVWTVEVR